MHQAKDAGLRSVLPVHTDCRQTWPGDCETSHDIKVDARKLRNKNTATLYGALPGFECLVMGFPAILLINGYTECLSRAPCDFGWLLRPLAMEPKARGAFGKFAVEEHRHFTARIDIPQFDVEYQRDFFLSCLIAPEIRGKGDRIRSLDEEEYDERPSVDVGQPIQLDSGWGIFRFCGLPI